MRRAAGRASDVRMLLTSVREAQPPAESLRGFIGRAPVERHQRARAPRDPGNLRAPFVRADRRHFDEVLAAIDHFFETMDAQHVSRPPEKECCRLQKRVHSSAPGEARKRKNDRRDVHSRARGRFATARA